MTIGAPMSASELEAQPRDEIAAALRSRCLALGGTDPAKAFRWPRHIRW